MKQGSKEWHLARLGKITGSRVGKIMDGGPRAWNSLLKELRYGLDHPNELPKMIDAPPLAHGRKYEKIALANYELITGIDVDCPAFIENSAYPGCSYSPDGLWPRMERLIEIKAPYNTKNHAATVMYGTGAKTYEAQIQFGMAITETNKCDFVSFDKRYPDSSKRLVIITVERNQKYIESMQLKIAKFLLLLKEGKQVELQTNEVPELF